MKKATISMNMTRNIRKTSTRILATITNLRPIMMSHIPETTRTITKSISRTFLSVVLPISQLD